MQSKINSYLDSANEVFDLEIDALQKAKQQIATTFQKAVELILSSKGKIVITGVGKSGIIAHKISATLASTGTPSVFLNASEALHGDLGMVSKGDIVIMLSKSGTTIELVKMLPTLHKVGAKTIGIFSNIETRLAKNLDLLLDATVEREACPLNLAPMSSTTVSLVIGDALAAALIKARDFKDKDFAVFHPAGQLGRNLLLTAADVMHNNENLPIVSAQNSLKEVVIVMTKYNLGAVCVCDETNKLEGIITDGDVRRFLTHSDTLTAKAEEIMTKNPISLNPTMRLSEVLNVMENKKRQIYVAPVIDEQNNCLGIVRMHDILGH
ncbi:KpsF/GutQ family protein [Bernardetia litoralis DSM 6794]|uniref:KpsF/GutQ family protein n=1 Tax=Bernardetia litoralis (strain ATCC 23117 / DSM 6794 / NBRC 15988 / NCIMB 1366 / Fx l1 / Sio-4) TaxID=880071 RepID=I4ANH6_BERLS|nr:KpsF/GutQ family sugar-phosphate isomerase [Bernardetia litoralis]AFM05511.1 KpsF/GutQ family protein [Bernardetia litoralis DSM 6794]